MYFFFDCFLQSYEKLKVDCSVNWDNQRAIYFRPIKYLLRVSNQIEACFMFYLFVSIYNCLCDKQGYFNRVLDFFPVINFARMTDILDSFIFWSFCFQHNRFSFTLYRLSGILLRHLMTKKGGGLKFFSVENFFKIFSTSRVFARVFCLCWRFVTTINKIHSPSGVKITQLLKTAKACNSNLAVPVFCKLEFSVCFFSSVYFP